MNAFVKTVLNLGCKQNKTGILRLCNNSKYELMRIDRLIQKTYTTLQKFPEHHISSVPCRMSVNTAFKEDDDRNSIAASQDLKEREHMHLILENSPRYSSTICPVSKAKVYVSDEETIKLLETDWSTASAADICAALKRISYNHAENGLQFTSQKYQNFFIALAQQLNQLNNDSIRMVLHHLRPFKELFKYPAFGDSFVKKLSQVCIENFLKSDVQNLLLTVDIFYQLELTKSDFYWRAVRRLGTRPNKLSAKNLVHFLFLLSECKVQNVNMYEIECRLQEVIDEISVSELGIVARGFFKSKNRFRDPNFGINFINKVAENVNELDSVNLAAVLKVIRYSISLKEATAIHNLLKAIIPELERLSVMCLTHVAHAASNISIYEESLMSNLAKRVKADMSQARIKDLERILYCFCMMCPESNDHGMCQSVVDELLGSYQTYRATELNKFPVSFVCILTKLAMKNIYPRDLINHVMHPDYIKQLQAVCVRFLPRDLWVLHQSLAIDIPDYDGPQLSNNVIRHLDKTYFQMEKKIAVSQNYTETFVTELAYMCKALLKKDILVSQVLPHHSWPDIILGFDENNELVDAESLLSSIPLGTTKRVDTDELKKIQWKALVVVPMSRLVRYTNAFNGLTNFKIRHLKAVGYEPILILQNEWNLAGTVEGKHNYIRNKLSLSD